MGDRFDRLRVRHANVESLLRRPAGIGHNGGPTFDMSWGAWVWRRAAKQAWTNPKPEVALRRIKRAEGLGITYREFASALMDTGSHLGAAVIPLSLAARVRRDAERVIVVEPRIGVAEKVAKFAGRLFLLGDIDAVPAMNVDERGGFLTLANRSFDGKFEAIGWGHDGPAIRAMLRTNNLAHQETFLVGAGIPHAVMAEIAHLPLYKDIDSWLT